MSIGQYRETVRVENPLGAPVPNGDGAYTQAYAPAVPPLWQVALDEPVGRIEERATPTGTTLALDAPTVRGRYRPDVDTRSRLVHRGRVLQVLGVQNVQTRFRELVVSVSEVPA